MRDSKLSKGTLLLALSLLCVVMRTGAAPFVNFVSPTNGQHVFNLVGLAGTAQAGTGSIQTVVFSIREVDINGGAGRWWNGTNFQSSSVLLTAQVAGTNWIPTNALPPLNSGMTYILAANMTNTLNDSASTNITVQAPTNSLFWDPGLTSAGTLTLSNPNTNGGNYWFKVTPQAPITRVWRLALNVAAGEADVYLKQGSPPTTSSFQFASQRVGSDGFVLDASQFTPGTDWYVLVTSTFNSQWTLVTGEAFVCDLGLLAADASSSTNAIVGAEGMAFFKTSITSNAPAWRLWLKGATNTLFVKKATAPTAASFDLAQSGLMLIVPPYLTTSNSSGRNFYVRAGAVGLNNGSDWNNAWRSCADIVWGGAGINAGDTVWFAGGLYTNTLTPTVSGTPDAWINIKRVRSTDFAATNAAGWDNSYDSQVVIDPGDHALFFYVSGLSYICVDGRVDSGMKLVCPNTEGAAVAIKQGVNYITLTNLDLSGPGGPTPVIMNGDNRGIDATAWNGSFYEPVNHLTVSHCRIHGQVNNLWLINCYNSTFEYCKIYDSAAANSGQFHANVCATSSSTNVTFRFNEIYNHQVEGIMFIFGGAANWYIYGNVWHDGMTGVSRVLEAQDGIEGPFYFYNNTIANVGTSIGTVNGGFYMPGSRGRNNIYWNTTVPGTPGFQQAYAGLPDNDYDFSNLAFFEPHAITNGANPFVSTNARDYHLVANIGANYPRDKGLTLNSNFRIAFDGNVRGADGSWDIGAYEFGSAAALTNNLTLPSGNPAAPYFVGVSAAPGTAISLESRVQTITDVPFGSDNEIILGPAHFPYVTFRVQVPSQTSAWWIGTMYSSPGFPNIAVRHGQVPNEFWNEGMAQWSPNADASLTLIPLWWPNPAGLKEGTYYVTVYSPTAFQTIFSNYNPTTTNGLTDTISGTLADNARAYYQFNMPASFSGAPVLGWRLDLNASNGTPSLRVRMNSPPDDLEGDGTSPYNTIGATISPSYLGPGAWFVEVRGGGATTYSLTSSVITTNTLRHPLWTMPAFGQSNVAAGLALPLIGDSGVDAAGNALPGDQGTDLAQGRFDYYAVIVPTNNSGVLHTELQKISGNPNLYLRLNAAPTTSHLQFGDYGNKVYDRSLTLAGNSSKYGNWVPLNGRYESQLAPGLWVLAVEAAGGANARYRLRISCGNAVSNGLVQDLTLNGGSFINQTLSGGDWRYYRVLIPTNPPANWVINWSRSAGNAAMFIRDTVPPGDGTFADDYSNPAFNPGPWINPLVQSLETSATDAKNQGPYPRYDTPGTVTLAPPPLRPGSVYYLGFWSSNATTFAVSSTNTGLTLDFTNFLSYSGTLTQVTLPANGSLSYRIDVPPEAVQLLFNVSNSPGVIFAMEQGTPARPGGPAHWTSSSSTINLERNLAPAGTWPWLPGYSYFLSVTNTSAVPRDFTLTLGRQFPTAAPILQTSESDGILRVIVPGQLGVYYIISASSDLKHWQPIYTNTTYFDFVDPDAQYFQERFYKTSVLFP
jgi:hypothetical protein